MRLYLILLIFSWCFLSLNGQSNTYEVTLNPIDIPDLDGLQSYVIGTHQDDWLIIGGRLDGLHGRQPFAAFNESGNNTHITVVNPKTKEVWKQNISELPVNLKEQLSSTNMQFLQDGDKLLLIGGYAYSPKNNDHITFPYLTFLDISKVIEKVKKNELTGDDFVQIEDENFRVTGGRLGKIGNTFFLVGGHKFMGRYNPMGPDHGPGFIQEYTNEIRKFNLRYEDNPVVEFLPAIHDEIHLRRRDYNLVPIITDKENGLMLYSGVFQKDINLPWLYPVRISSDTYTPIEEFTQKFNHYHCATLPIYNASDDEMHTLFFGGIAQFYINNDTLVQDNDVPFVKTITDVIHLKNGTIKEEVNSSQLPNLLGAGSEFILSPSVSLHDHGIIDGDLLTGQDMAIGYIYGGIKSTKPNIFWINSGTESEASNTIFQVSIRKKETTSTVALPPDDFKLLIYPNPAQGMIRMTLSLDKVEDILVSIFDNNGRKVNSTLIDKSSLHLGKNFLTLDQEDLKYGAYFYTIKIGDHITSRKVIWSE